jgi:hypothetical protein
MLKWTINIFSTTSNAGNLARTHYPFQKNIGNALQKATGPDDS